MEITAQLVMQLREKTGVSMMACKKALTEANGDEEKAIEILRKSGEAKSASKADRETKEGRLFIKYVGKKLAVVSISCETDFVARNDDFVNMGNTIVEMALNEGVDKATASANAIIKESIVKLGENMGLLLIKVLEGDVWGSYIHSTNKVGAIVSLSNGNETLAKDIAMHITATNPKYLSPTEVSAEEVAKEQEIWKSQLQTEGKPEAIWKKIMMGKEKKFREENALLTAPFVKDPRNTIEKVLDSATITSFERFAV